jgi:tetratricopeptide (TPR) repeat protein
MSLSTTKDQPIPQTLDEKVQFASGLKDEGNTFFRNGEYKKAIHKYKRMFLYLTGIGSSPMEVFGSQMNTAANASSSARANEKMKAVDQLILTANLNLSQCYLKISPPDYRRAKEYADKVLQKEADNAKALFRRAQAYMGMQDVERARQDLQKAESLSPNDPLIKQHLKKLEQIEKQQDKKQKELYKKLFQKMEEDTEQ